MWSVHTSVQYAGHTVHTLARSLFWAVQTNDDKHETIVAISLVVAPKWWSYVVLWKILKHSCCHGLATKHSLRQFSDIVRHLVCVLLQTTFTDLPMKMQHKIVYLSIQQHTKTHIAWRRNVQGISIPLVHAYDVYLFIFLITCVIVFD